MLFNSPTEGQIKWREQFHWRLDSVIRLPLFGDMGPTQNKAVISKIMKNKKAQGGAAESQSSHSTRCTEAGNQKTRHFVQRAVSSAPYNRSKL